MTDSGYDIFFNRDEKRQRAKAIAPRLFLRNNVRFLSPQDPKGGGSWIAVNQFGLSLCLLNAYQTEPVAPQDRKRLVSRGILLFSLMDSFNLEQVRQSLRKKVHLSKSGVYEGFTLLVFKGSPWAFRWDGRKLIEFSPSRFITSSSEDFYHVQQWRQQQYDKLLTLSPQSLIHLHRFHNETRPHQGICLHREDSETVSFSQIQVNDSQSIFTYQAGAPCLNAPLHSYHMAFESDHINDKDIIIDCLESNE